MGIMLEKDYASGRLSGWLGQDVAKYHWDLIRKSDSFKYFRLLPPTANRRMMLFDVARKVLGKDTDNYPQQIGDPFVAGSKILMADGTEKNIEDVKIGDIVINHKNQEAKVNNTIHKKFTGDLVTIKVKGWHKEITATETHHGMILPYTQYRFKYKKEERCKFGEMKIGDYVAIPHGVQKNDKIFLDLKDYCNYDSFDDKYLYLKDRKALRNIEVNEKFARFIGLYLAEGGLAYSNGSFNFSFNTKETYYMEEVKNLAKEIFDVETSLNKTGCEACTRVSVKSRIVTDFMSKFVDGNIYSKTVPDIFFNCSKEIKIALLRGWLDGDGYKNFDINTVIGYTSSNQMGDDMLRLAVSCGINTKSWRRFRKIRASKENTEVAFYGTEPYKIYPEKDDGDTTEITCNDTPYGFARKITNITRTPVVDHDVYCITTEGEFTIVVNGVSSYNCVSFGMKNAMEYLQCCEILMNKDAEEFKPIFPPYLYGIGRIYIGNGQLGNEDGSLGSWMADAIVKYGIVNTQEDGLPKYSGEVAKLWGGPNGKPYLDKWKSTGQKHLVKSAAPVKNWDQLVAAICNGYPCTIASNQGFQMKPDSNGFHQASGNWGHQMCVIAIDDEYSEPYVIILNNWGDCHGELFDFNNKEKLPVGTLRVKKNVMINMINTGECFAISNFDGFKTQNLSKELFKLI